MAKGLSLRADVRRIIKQVEDRGFRVELGGSGHYKILHPETGQFLGSLAATPSDRRGIRNAVADLRSRGVLGEKKQEERKVQMAQTRSERTPSLRQQELRNRVVDVMVGRGWTPNGRTGVQAQVAKEIAAMGGHVMTTKGSADETLRPFLAGSRPVSDRALDKIEQWLDGKTQAEPSPAAAVNFWEKKPDNSERRDKVADRMRKVMNDRGFVPGGRTGVQAQLARELLEHEGPVSTHMSAMEAIKRLLAGEKRSSDESLDQFEMLLDDIETRPEVKAPAGTFVETPKTLVKKEEEGRNGRPIKVTLQPLFDRLIADLSVGKGEPRSGRRIAHGVAQDLQKLIEAWAADHKPSTEQPSHTCAQSALDSRHHGTNMWHRNVDAVEGLVQAWDEGWRPKADQEQTVETDDQPADADIYHPVFPSIPAAEQTTDDDLSDQGKVAEKNGRPDIPLHVQVLAEMLRNPDASPGYRDNHVRNAIDLAVKVMELEEAQ